MSDCFCCQTFRLGRRAVLASLAVGVVMPASASPGAAPASAGPASAGPPNPYSIDDLVTANHILYDQGVVDGFGHISVRHDKDPNRYLLSRSMAPALVTADDIMEYDLDSNPVDAAGRTSYLERFIHGEIYKRRPDVISIVHSHSASVIPFADTGVPLRPMSHMAGFLANGVPVFEIRKTAGLASNMLISNDKLGQALATALGTHTVALMRGHGSVAAAQSIRHVVLRAVYTEVNARMQADALRLGTPIYLNREEGAAAAKTIDSQVDRPWSLWKQHALTAR